MLLMVNTMTNLELQVAQWHENTFGKRVDIPATYKKLLEEVGELGEALMRQNQDEITEEAGDVALVLMHLIRGSCPDTPGIIDVAALALDKCERRRRLKQGGKAA